MINSSKVAIIGGGISGLIASLELEQAGFTPILIEASSKLGGRLQTDIVKGVPLDHGFQVLLTAYPNVKKYIDVTGLELELFKPGAIVFKNRSKYKLGDFKRDNSFLWGTLMFPYASISDKLKIKQLSDWIQTQSIENIFSKQDISTYQYLKNSGFSEKVINHFFKPFYSGIFLENNLETSSRMFLFVFKMFAEGNVGVPKNGIHEIANQLISKLRRSDIKLNTRVTKVQEHEVHLDNGETIEVDFIIQCTNDLSLCSCKEEVEWNSCSNYYFEIEEGKLNSHLIGLVPNPKSILNNISVLPKRTDENKQVLSVTLIGKQEKSLTTEEVAEEIKKYCKITVGECLGKYNIPKALPRYKKLRYSPKAKWVNPYTVLAGDSQGYPSLNSAMESAKIAVEELRNRI